MKYSLTFLALIITLININLFAQTKILVSIANESNDDASIFQLDESGNIEKELFNFKNQPLVKTGNIYNLNSNSDGSAIYFSSDNAQFYSLSSRNVFKLSSNGNNLSQITPGPYSGQTPLNVATGSVKGRITDSQGIPYSGAAIFMEGLPFIYSDANGYFKFDNVPQGHRWITGYKPASLVYQSLPVYVTPNLTSEVELVPYTDYKSRFEMPKEFNGKIYYIANNLELYKINPNGENREKIFSTIGLTGIGGFDIANQDGQIILSDFRTGTPEQRGLYTCDQNGNNLSLFLDFKQDNNWGDLGEVFWSPDKSKIALKASYNYYTYIVIIDVNSKNILGTVYFDQNYTIYNVDLHGWSPDGKWLLYSNWLEKPDFSTLAKIKVGSDGSLNPNDNINLIVNRNISSACWTKVNNSSSTNEKTSLLKSIKAKIYPNPAKDFIELQLVLKEKGNVTIPIYNEEGVLVNNIINEEMHSGINTIKYDCSNLTTGMYYISIYHNNKIQSENTILKL